MAYEPTEWVNREVERPRTFNMIDNPDGSKTLVPAEGNIIVEGTPLLAGNLNNMEQGIVDAHQGVDALEQGIQDLVPKEAGKGLSTNDYTTAEKTKLAGIEAGAQKNTVTSVAGRTGAVVLTKTDVALSNVDNAKQMPIAGGTFTGVATANNNTAYTTKQLRNITLSTANPTGGANGDIWLKYKP